MGQNIKILGLGIGLFVAGAFLPQAQALPPVTHPPLCGDATIDDGEQCDDGAWNGTDDSSCSSECTWVPFCGNGVVEGTETCDDGNDLQDDGCGNDCRPSPDCGNGALDGNEECDEGPNNGQADSECMVDCRWVPEENGEGEEGADTGEETEAGNDDTQPQAIDDLTFFDGIQGGTACSLVADAGAFTGFLSFAPLVFLAIGRRRR